MFVHDISVREVRQCKAPHPIGVDFLGRSAEGWCEAHMLANIFEPIMGILDQKEKDIATTTLQ